MRRSLILSTVLAASVAVLGACDPKVNVPEKPAATPVPAVTASPAASPVASPAKPGDSPAKPTTSPEVKKDDGKNTNKNTRYLGPPVTPDK